MPGMTTKKKHPSDLKRQNGKFSTMRESISGKKKFKPPLLPTT
jgi:hypothetical protein